MILILSGDGDVSTDLVVESLSSLNYPYVRLNSFDLLDQDLRITILEGNTYLTISGKDIDINSIGSVWYRKFGFFYKSQHYKSLKDISDTTVANNISKEFTSLLETIVHILLNKNWLTHPSTIGLNKLDVLRRAQLLGIDVPPSYITNSKQYLNELMANHDCISKSIRDPWVISGDIKNFEKPHSMFTSVIDGFDLNFVEERFFPSFIQKKIEKEFEIRTFFLESTFYSMAIFSQLDNQTSIDFRRYNWDKPNRRIPYKLPAEFEIKLKKLLRLYEFNCCSIDIIKSTDGKYYLLEINPTGQFGMVDFPCNYGLHQKVANYLIKLDNAFHEKKTEAILQNNRC